MNNKLSILHIINNLDKKNFSIYSLIKKHYFFFKKDYQFYLITNLNKLSNKENFIHLNKGNIFNKVNFFLNFLNNKKIKFIHFHGMWKIEDLLYLYLCKAKKISIYIHPHGMLLKEALLNKGFLNYIKKIIYIKFFYKLLLPKNCNFLSITKKETKSIKFFFKKNQVYLINNFATEKNYLKQKTKKSNTFICLTRINKHKNLHKLINTFSKLNLNPKWKLDIYGIKDDDDYFELLKNQIKSNNIQNIIKIKKPVFGKKKKKIIDKSWCNILISESEVISQSVIDSANNYLPSIISKNIIESGWIKNGCLSCNNLEDSLDKTIIRSTNWSLYERILRGNKINKFIKKKYDINKILTILKKVYKKTSE